jgi:hypothetical protein
VRTAAGFRRIRLPPTIGVLAYLGCRGPIVDRLAAVSPTRPDWPFVYATARAVTDVCLPGHRLRLEVRAEVHGMCIHLQADALARRTKKERPRRRGGLSEIDSGVRLDQADAIATALFFAPLKANKPRPMKPATSIVQVDGSGVWATSATVNGPDCPTQTEQ